MWLLDANMDVHLVQTLNKLGVSCDCREPGLEGVRVAWKYKRIYVKEFLSHAEYDRGRWKKWLV